MCSPPKAEGEVGKASIALYSVEALVGRAVFQCAQRFSVRTNFDIIKGCRVEVFRKFLASTVPSCFEGSPVVLLHRSKDLLHCRRVIVASH